MGWIPVKLSRHLTLQNLGNIHFLVIFSILGGPRKVDDLPTSPNNQFRDYFIRNRIEKLVTLNWNFAPQTLKTENNNRPNCFQTLFFFAKSGFPKTRDLSLAAPRGVYISRNDLKQNRCFWEMAKT